MIFVLEAVGICKMCPGTSKLCRVAVHHTDKFFCRASDMRGNGRSCVVAGIHKKSVDKLVHGHLITGNKSDHLGTFFKCYDFLGDRNHIIHIAILESQKCGHDLGDTCRIDSLIGALGIHNCLIVQIKKQTFLIFFKRYGVQRLVSGNDTETVSKQPCSFVCHSRLVRSKFLLDTVGTYRTGKKISADVKERRPGSSCQEQYKKRRKDHLTAAAFPFYLTDTGSPAPSFQFLGRQRL